MIKVHYFYNINFYKDSPSSNCSLWVDRITILPFYTTYITETVLINCYIFHFSGHMKEAKECGSSEEASSAQKVYEIGDVMDEKSKNVTDQKKYIMFKNHFRPGEKYVF